MKVESVWKELFGMVAQLEEGDGYGLPRGAACTLQLMLLALLENWPVGMPIHKDTQALIHVLA